MRAVCFKLKLCQTFISVKCFFKRWTSSSPFLVYTCESHNRWRCFIVYDLIYLCYEYNVYALETLADYRVCSPHFTVLLVMKKKQQRPWTHLYWVLHTLVYFPLSIFGLTLEWFYVTYPAQHIMLCIIFKISAKTNKTWTVYVALVHTVRIAIDEMFW